jgi:hypothetical protein
MQDAAVLLHMRVVFFNFELAIIFVFFLPSSPALWFRNFGTG